MKKILILYIEPTPYMLGLIKLLSATWQGNIDVVFLAQNVSQAWNLEVGSHGKILSKNPLKKIMFFLRIFFRSQYDLVHLAGWAKFSLLFCLIMAKLLKIPVVVESDSQLNHYTVYWRRVIKRLFYPILFNLVNLFLSAGTRQGKYFEHYGVKSNRIISANMTVDVVKIQQRIKELSPRDLQTVRDLHQINSESKVFVFVGRLVTDKGILDLITAITNIADKNIVLLIVGDGPLRSQVEQATVQHPQLRYAGRLMPEQLIAVYGVASVLVLPAYREPWGLVINEAMAAGLPVIVSDCVGCIDDLVVHQETGLIVKTGSIEQLQQAMVYLATHTQQCKVMGAKGAEKIASWTLENEAKNITDAWDTLLPSFK